MFLFGVYVYYQFSEMCRERSAELTVRSPEMPALSRIIIEGTNNE